MATVEEDTLSEIDVEEKESSETDEENVLSEVDIESCLKEITELTQSIKTPFPRQSLKSIIDMLWIKSFKEISQKQQDLLAQKLLGLLLVYENEDLEEEDEFGFHRLGKHVTWLYPLNIQILSNLIPSMSEETLQIFLSQLRRLINEYKDEHLFEISLEIIAYLAMYMEKDEQKIVYDLVRKFLLKGKFQIEPLKRIARDFLNDAERFELFQFLINLLDQKSEDRNWQKSLEWTLSKLFQILPNEQKKEIFGQLIEPLVFHRNFYVRQALVEFLDHITGFEKERMGLLSQLQEDPESEVRRFTENSKFLMQINRNKETLERTVRTRNVASQAIVVKPKSSGDLAHQFSIRVKKILRTIHVNPTKKPNDSFSKEYNDFLKTPINQINQASIRGLSSHNFLIFEHCWEKLYNKLYRRGTANDKKKWISHLRTAFNNGSPFKYSDRVIKHIFWDLRKDPVLRDDTALMILSVLQRDTEHWSRDWINEFYSLVSEGISPAIITESFAVIKKIMTNPKANHELKYYLISTVTCMQVSAQQRVLLIRFFVEEFNNIYRNELEAIAAEQLRWTFRGQEEMIDISEEMLFELSNVNVNAAHEQGTVLQIFQFMLFVLSQEGGSPLGIAAVSSLEKMINNSQDSAHYVSLREGLYAYNLSSLAILNQLELRINAHLTNTPKNNYQWAWQEYLEKNYDSSLTRLNKMIKGFSRNHQSRLRLGNLFYLKALNHLALKQMMQAQDSLKQCQRTWADDYRVTFLKGEIKFQENNLGQALKYYNRVIWDCPFYLHALRKIYESCYQLKNYLDAECTLEKIQELNSRYIPPNFRHRLSNIDFSSIYCPFRTDIEKLERFLEDYISFCMSELKQDNSPDTRQSEFKRDNSPDTRQTIQERIQERFSHFKNKLIEVFGSKVVNNFNLMSDIPWEKLCCYPQELIKYLKNILGGIITQEIPPEYHVAYQSFREQLQTTKNLVLQFEASEVSQLIQEPDPLSYIQSKATVLTAYEFVYRFGFKMDLDGGYALGLSNELTEAYNIFVSFFSLKHWSIAYDELDVEPSGELKHTQEFLSKVILTKQPIVLFIPANTPLSRITRDEVNFFLEQMKNDDYNLGSNLILVFGGYNLLPLSILQNDLFKLRKRAPERSFKTVVTYLADIMGYRYQFFQPMFQHFFEHLLITCIKRAFIDNVGEEEQENYYSYKMKFNDLLLNKINFNSLLKELIKNLSYTAKETYTDKETDLSKISKNNCYLNLLENLLFHGVPWFGSRLQPNQSDLLTLERLKEDLNREINMLRFNRGSKALEYIEKIKKFLSSLNAVLDDIKFGLHWRGISDFKTKSHQAMEGSPSEEHFDIYDAADPEIEQKEAREQRRRASVQPPSQQMHQTHSRQIQLSQRQSPQQPEQKTDAHSESKPRKKLASSPTLPSGSASDAGITLTPKEIQGIMIQVGINVQNQEKVAAEISYALSTANIDKDNIRKKVNQVFKNLKLNFEQGEELHLRNGIINNLSLKLRSIQTKSSRVKDSEGLDKDGSGGPSSGAGDGGSDGSAGTRGSSGSSKRDPEAGGPSASSLGRSFSGSSRGRRQVETAEVGLSPESTRFIKINLKDIFAQGFIIGNSYNNGDCFFISMAKVIEESGRTIPGSKEYDGCKKLRVLCHQYLLQSSNNKWVKEAMDKDAEKGGTNYKEAVDYIQYTQREADAQGRTPTWGRPAIEGKIICECLGVKLHCVDVHAIIDCDLYFVSDNLVKQGKEPPSVGEGIAIVITQTIKFNAYFFTNAGWVKDRQGNLARISREETFFKDKEGNPKEVKLAYDFKDNNIYDNHKSTVDEIIVTAKSLDILQNDFAYCTYTASNYLFKNNDKGELDYSEVQSNEINYHDKDILHIICDFKIKHFVPLLCPPMPLLPVQPGHIAATPPIRGTIGEPSIPKSVVPVAAVKAGPLRTAEVQSGRPLVPGPTGPELATPAKTQRPAQAQAVRVEDSSSSPSSSPSSLLSGRAVPAASAQEHQGPQHSTQVAKASNQGPPSSTVGAPSHPRPAISSTSRALELQIISITLQSANIYRNTENSARELPSSNKSAIANTGPMILPPTQDPVGGRLVEEQHARAFLPGRKKFEKFLKNNGLIATEVYGGRLNCYIHSLLQHATGQYYRVKFDDALIDTIKRNAGISLSPAMIDPNTDAALRIIKAINDLYKVNLVVHTFQINEEGKPGIVDSDRIFDKTNRHEARPVFLWLQPAHFVAIASITLYNFTFENKQHQEQENQESGFEKPEELQSNFWELNKLYINREPLEILDIQLAIQEEMQRRWGDLSPEQQLALEGLRYWASLKLQEEYLDIQVSQLDQKTDVATLASLQARLQAQKQSNIDIQKTLDAPKKSASLGTEEVETRGNPSASSGSTGVDTSLQLSMGSETSAVRELKPRPSVSPRSFPSVPPSVGESPEPTREIAPQPPVLGDRPPVAFLPGSPLLSGHQLGPKNALIKLPTVQGEDQSTPRKETTKGRHSRLGKKGNQDSEDPETS